VQYIDMAKYNIVPALLHMLWSKLTLSTSWHARNVND